MQNTKQAASANEYRNIALASLVESPTNPRKRFDETSLRELAASIKAQGLLEPLLVREREQEKNRYEVVIGARRLRAAKIAGVSQVPVRVVKSHRCTNHRGPGSREPATRGHSSIRRSDGFSFAFRLEKPQVHDGQYRRTSRKERSVCAWESQTDRTNPASGRGVPKRQDCRRPCLAHCQAACFATAGGT